MVTVMGLAGGTLPRISSATYEASAEIACPSDTDTRRAMDPVALSAAETMTARALEDDPKRPTEAERERGSDLETVAESATTAALTRPSAR